MLKLKCTVQNYAWGKIGECSEVYQLINIEKGLDKSKPYAELWMGTHPSGPSVLDNNSMTTLKDFITKNPSSLGLQVSQRFKQNLPFLFKVLSVNQALSIQAHPNKIHAEQLHKLHPELYKDDNHKPEMAIALTPFEAMLGFRQVAEIANYVKSIPELLELVKQQNLDLLNSATLSDSIKNQTEAIKAAFSNMMKTSESKVGEMLSKLLTRLNSNPTGLEPELVSLVKRLASVYPGDVGCFSVFFMNVLQLQPGEVIYLAENVPHAYLAGDCVECMACSDNVVRAGLTPKFKDVDCLLGMLDYRPRSPASLRFAGRETRVVPAGGAGQTACLLVTSYQPDVEDFAVDKICLSEDGAAFSYPVEFTLPAASSASILLCIHGSVQLIDTKSELACNRGSIVFVVADVQVRLRLVANQPGSGKLLLFRARVNLSG